MSRNTMVELYLPEERLGARVLNVIWVKDEPIRMVQEGEQVLLSAIR